MKRFCLIGLLALATPAALYAEPSPPASAGQPALNSLFADWRQFVAPETVRGVPDYSAAAMARKAAALPAWRARLAGLDRTGWDQQSIDDARLVGAEMSGLDFSLRVLKPWARDPGFYANVFGEESDVPAHEGPSAQPNIDLFAWKWPLSRADDRALAARLATVPALLGAAKVNLADSQAHDLWAYGDRAFREQAEMLAQLEAGTLSMRTLDGHIPATLNGASPALRKAVADARVATLAFADWVKAEAPKRTGPSGVGKANYDWYLKNVTLSPYSYDEQVVLLRRELDRALASLAQEEARNRALPPLAALTDPAAYRAMAEARTAKWLEFMIAAGIVPDRPYYRAAMAAQTSAFIAPDKLDFFGHGSMLDPLPLLSHSSHWIELARLKNEPNPDPVRRPAPLFNIFEDRSEGFATAMEEIAMQLGLYDDQPRSREIVWIMLANRAARGLASLYVQDNRMTLAEAGRFHAGWTPRGWSDPNSRLVGFEQLLYLRQPGYGPSYIVGKLQADDLLARASHQAQVDGRPFSLPETWARIMAAGIVPPALIADELGGAEPVAPAK